MIDTELASQLVLATSTIAFGAGYWVSAIVGRKATERRADPERREPIHLRIKFDPDAPKLLSRTEVWKYRDGEKCVTVVDFTTGVHSMATGRFV